MSAISAPFLEIIALIAILHCLMLSLIILFSRFFRSETNKYLGYTLLIIALVGINNWFWDIGFNPIIIQISDLFLWQFLYPATLFIFFYKASKYTETQRKLKFVYFPFILLSAINIIVSLGVNFNMFRLPGAVLSYIPAFYKSISLLSVIFPVYLIILSGKYALTKKDKLSKKWLQHLWSFLTLIILFGVVLESYRFLFSDKLPLTFLWTFISIFIYWLIYKGFYQFKLSNDQYEIRTIVKKEKTKSQSSVNSKSSHFKRLIFLIEEEKIHHNASLSRDVVAEQLGISSGYLSQIIKENTNSGFSDFLNSYRIKDVKKMIKDSKFDKYNLLSIGLECGFNSKTSFNTNFKKETGLTPQEFKIK